MQQLLLDVKPKKQGEYLVEDFLPLSGSFSAHQIAVSSLANNLTGCLIMGPKGVGKTHLLNVCLQHLAANEGVLAFNDIAKLTMPKPTDKFLLIDNISTLNLEQQELLFHWYNHLKTIGGKMILVTENNLDDLIQLKDLKSRLLTLQQAILEYPNDKDLEIFILKQAFDRQIIISEDVLNYILLRLERNFNKAEDLMDKIDEESLREKRKITVPFIKEFLD